MIKYLDLQAITAMHAAQYEEAVSRVMQRGWFLQGEENKRFETHYADYIGTKHCIAVANGLDALKLILQGYLQLGVFAPGNEIIVPSNTYIATILAVSECGLVPVLVEPTFDNLTLDIDSIEEAITHRTRGVMTVHLYGRIAYNEKLRDICQRHNLKLMEDAAQSHGCSYRGVRTGALGDAAAHSFYPGKNLGAMGDAGAVTTCDDALAEVVRVFANYGSQQKYHFKYKGMNSRMSEIDAAILDVKLQYLETDNLKRKQLANLYWEGIKNPKIVLPQKIEEAENVYHIFPVFCEERDALQQYLEAHGIQTLIHYPIPPHQQECYKEWAGRSYPISEQIHKTELSLPLNQAMTENEVQRVVDVLNAF